MVKIYKELMHDEYYDYWVETSDSLYISFGDKGWAKQASPKIDKINEKSLISISFDDIPYDKVKKLPAAVYFKIRKELK
jgi:hypothetical protein